MNAGTRTTASRIVVRTSMARGEGAAPRPAARLSGLVALLPFAFALTPMPGCESGTGGRAVHLRLAVASAPAAGEPLGVFSTETGWRVTLSEAYVSLGPIYVYADPGVTAARVLGGSFGLPVARAHAGHDHLGGRAVRAEFLGQVVFDALSPAGLDLGEVEGTAGHAAELTVDLRPPRGADAAAEAPLRGRQAWVEGVAERDGARVWFRGGLDIPDEALARRVSGIPVDADIDDGGTLILEVHLRAWFAAAHFDRLTAQDPDGAFVITSASQPRTAWYLGVRSAAAYSTRWNPAPVAGGAEGP
jgi:hypothetical protein